MFFGSLFPFRIVVVRIQGMISEVLLGDDEWTGSGQISSRPHTTWAPKWWLNSKGNPLISGKAWWKEDPEVGELWHFWVTDGRHQKDVLMFLYPKLAWKYRPRNGGVKHFEEQDAASGFLSQAWCRGNVAWKSWKSVFVASTSTNPNKSNHPFHPVKPGWKAKNPHKSWMKNGVAPRHHASFVDKNRCFKRNHVVHRLISAEASSRNPLIRGPGRNSKPAQSPWTRGFKRATTNSLSIDFGFKSTPDLLQLQLQLQRLVFFEKNLAGSRRAPC